MRLCLVTNLKRVSHACGQKKRGVIKFMDVGEDCTKGCLNLRGPFILL